MPFWGPFTPLGGTLGRVGPARGPVQGLSVPQAPPLCGWRWDQQRSLRHQAVPVSTPGSPREAGSWVSGPPSEALLAPRTKHTGRAAFAEEEGGAQAGAWVEGGARG